jgi:hypothetical protein
MAETIATAVFFGDGIFSGAKRDGDISRPKNDGLWGCKWIGFVSLASLKFEGEAS